MILKKDDLERQYRWISVTIVALFGLALSLGLVLYVIDQHSTAANAALKAGIVLLMASPVVRMLVACAERLRRRDWSFLLMTAVVALELAVVLRYAAARH